MNKLWVFLVIFGIGYGIVIGRVEEVSNAILDSCQKSIELLFSMGGIMVIWTGIMNIGQESGIIKRFSLAIKPLIKKLFPRLDPNGKTVGLIVMNFAANFLGLGNAATPFGIKAMNEMRKINDNNEHISNEMLMFLIINISSLQLIPSTVIAIRRNVGSTNPVSILPPVWYSSIVSTVVGIILVLICTRKNKRK